MVAMQAESAESKGRQDKPGKADGDKDKILETARKRWAAAAEAVSQNEKTYIEDLKMSCTDDMWDEEAKNLRGRDRPMLTINRLNPVIKQIIGDYRQHKLSIRVLPASGDASEDVADLLGGLIRNIEQQSDADMAYATALDCAARGGYGYFRICTEYTGDDVFEQDFRIVPIANPLTVKLDPSAKLVTRADANWGFITDMVPEDEFKRLYPKAKVTAADRITDDSMGGWYSEQGVRVAEYFEKVYYPARLVAFSNGITMEVQDDAEIYAMEQIGGRVMREREAQRTKVKWRKISGNDILDSKEYRLRYIPIVRVSGEEVNVEGKLLTRGAIHYAKDAAKMYCYWKTAATESVALSSKAPWLVTAKQIEGLEEQWDRANTDPMPYLVYNFDPKGAPMPQRISPPDQPLGEMAMAMGASDDIKATTGMYDASLGARGNETSGKAIVARQQEGDTATFLFIDNLCKGIQQCGRIIVDWMPEIYDEERVARVLDLEGNPSMEVLNQRQHDPMTGVTTILNSVTVGKYDVVIDTGPNFASRKQEGTAAMTQLAQAYPPVMGVAGDLIVGGMDFPGSKQIAERMKRAMPPQITTDPDSPEGQQAAAAQQQQQAQAAEAHQAVMQVQQGKVQAENAKSTAQIAKANAEVVKAKADTAIAALGARQTAVNSFNPASPAT